MAEYLLLLHESPSKFKSLSPTEMQAMLGKYSAWAGKLGQAGRLVGGKKLTEEGGRHLRRDRGQMVASEGPYAEARDVVSGIFIVTATDYEDARALAADCPHLENGWIEVRAVDAM